MMNVPETEAGVGVMVNGEPRRVPAGLNVEGLLAFLSIDPERVAIELTREIVRRPAWVRTPIEDGAELEIVMFVGGG